MTSINSQRRPGIDWPREKQMNSNETGKNTLHPAGLPGQDHEPATCTPADAGGIRRLRMPALRPGVVGEAAPGRRVRRPAALRVPPFSRCRSAPACGTGGRSGRGGCGAGQVLADARAAVPPVAAPESGDDPARRRGARARHDALSRRPDDHVYLQRVREHHAAGVRLGLRGTPCFFLNDRPVDVSFSLQNLENSVRAALGEA